MTDQDNLRNRIAAKILDNFNPPDDKHPSWWINPEASAQAIIDELHLFAEVDEDWGAMVIEGWWEKQ